MALGTKTLLLLAVMLVLATATVTPLVVRAEAYTVSFVVVGLPSGVKAQIWLDGNLNGTIQSGETKTLQFTPGPLHMLSVDAMIAGTNGTRYQCRDNPPTGQPPNVWQFNDTGSHTFTYITQYYFEVQSPYGSAPPSEANWYDKGATAHGQLTKNMTEGPEGVRYVFTNWEGDASGQGMTSDPIIMDGPKKAVAVWKTQYTLRISSDPVDIFSPSRLWLDAGSNAQLSAPNATALSDIRYVFSEWTGDYNGTDPQGSLQMNGPKVVTAKYRTQYLLSITFTPSELAQEQGMPKTSWHDAGQTVSLGPVLQFRNVSSAERLVFMFWRVDNITQQGTSIDVPMDAPRHVEVTYRTQYYLTVTSRLGETVGSGWYFSGDKARFSVAYGGSDFPVKYSLADWQPNPRTTITKVSANEAEIVMDRAYVVEAIWNADYTPAWIFLAALASVVIVIVGVVVVAVKRPGSFGRFFSSFRNRFRARKVERPGKRVPVPPHLVICQNCGASVASSAGYCHSCGASIGQRQRRAAVDIDTLDERVYDYIVKRHGEISLSQASKDIGISVDDLKNSTNRLKKKGRLA